MEIAGNIAEIAVVVIAVNIAEPVGSADCRFAEASEPPSSEFHCKLHSKVQH